MIWQSEKVSVVLVPSMFNLDSFENTLVNKILKLPIEGAAYQDGVDEPWIVDKDYDDVDDFGRVWKISKK